MTTEKYLIVGLGVYGASTALHLLDADSQNPSELTVVSHCISLAPSEDISKIIRVDYTSARRMKEAIRAQEHWMNDDRFNQFYLPVGRIVAYDEMRLQTLDEIDQTRLHMGRHKRERLDGSILAKIFGSTGALSKLTFVHNEDDGLVEWEGCMQAMRDSVRERCRENKESVFLETQVQDLVHCGERITAVTLADDRRIGVADKKVILAAGPWITEILERSSIERPPHSRIPIATGVFAFILQLNEEQTLFFKGKPALSQIGYAEFLPPTKDDSIAKITRITPFTYLSSALSRPKDVAGSSLAVQCMLEMAHWARKTLPRLKGARITSIKSYWDGVTETQNPLLARHPHFENLFITGGGSYNRAKDLPILGEDVVSLVNGGSVDSCYHWESSGQSIHHDQPGLLAGASFQDLDRDAEKNPEVKNWMATRKSQDTLEYLEVI